jgi:hypothetical protein
MHSADWASSVATFDRWSLRVTRWFKKPPGAVG